MDRKPPPRRLAWRLSELPASLSAEARDRLLAVNAGFDAASRWADLERPLAVEVHVRALSASAKERRRALTALVAALEEVDRTLLKHPRTRADLLAALAVAHAPPSIPRPLPFALVVRTYRQAALDALTHDVPAQGGRPPLASRDRVIAMTCAWVERLPPLRAREAVRLAIRRNAAQDTQNPPLRAPDDALARRSLASVKIVLGDLKLPPPPDLPAKIRTSLAKQPTAK